MPNALRAAKIRQVKTSVISRGTPIFDGEAAQKGYALNKMCFSFNDAANRAAFLRDESAYCAQFGLMTSSAMRSSTATCWR